MRLDAWNASGEMNEATRKSAREELSTPDSVPSSISDPGMELGLNSWLPAYGFHASQMQLQIQTAPHHLSNFQPLSLQEDNRSTDGLLVQQVEFLETIFEETSDDLQSDSDRSGTTYWVGSDSETESVIHIRAPFADEKHDGSGSDCNSVVPKKRRRKNGVREEDDAMTMFADNEDESSSSSRSSSLLQFESLERNCAIGGCRDSPSSYSFDSLEFASRSASNGGGGGDGGGGGSGGNDNPSPDSLESFDESSTSSRPRYGGANGVAKIRPYRSFESLEVCQIRDDAGRRSNGVESSRRGIGPRSFVASSSVWDDYDVDEEEEEEEEEEEYDEEEDFDDFEGFDEDVRATTNECRNVIDLREIGIETKRDFVSELRSGQAIAPQSSLQSRLNIATNAGRGCGCDSSQQGWSESSFNFRFTDKSRSVPSLVSDARTNGSPVPSRRHTLPPESLLFGSSSQDFQDFHRVCSCPVGLNLCGATEPSDAASESLRDARTGPKMAENDASATPEARSPTVRTQDRTETNVLVVPVPVDAGADVESIVDEAVRQFEREVAASGGAMETSRPRRVKNNASYELAQQFEVRGNLNNGSDHPEPPRRFRVKNNASYELAQQYDFVRALGGPNFRSFRRMDACDELEEPGTSATASTNGSRLKVTDLVEEMDRSYAATSANDLTALRATNHPPDDARVYSKSNEDVRRPANGIARQPRNDAEAVVSRIKKNSDLFSTSGKSGSDESVDDATVKPSSEPLDDHHHQPPSSPPPLPPSPPPPHHHYRHHHHRSSQSQRHESRDALPPDRLPPREPQPPSHESQLSPPDSRSELLAATNRISSGGGGGGSTTLDEGYAERNGVLAASDEGYGAGGGATDSENRQRPRASLNSTEYSEARAGSTSATNVYAAESASSTREASRVHGSTPNLRGMSLLGELYPERGAREGVTFDDDPFLDDVDEGIGSVKDYERDGGCFRGSVRSESAIGSRRRVGDGPRSGSSTTSGNTSLLGDGSTSSVWATSCRPEADSAYPLHDRCAESFQREASLKRGGTVEGKQTSAANSPGSPGSELPTMSSGMISSSSPTPKTPPPTTTTTTTTTTGEKKKGGLGGFLQRFSKLRFSGRSKVPRSELLSNKKSGTNTGKVQQQQRDNGNNAPDYVIIPLHGPSINDEEGNRQTLRPQEPSGSSTNLERTGSNVSSNSRSTGISSKPPLPPQLTPRSGAQAGARSSSGVATRRRAATDLGSSTGIEMAKARAMQAAFERPVGLLETDLDAADVVAASRDTRQVAPGAATASSSSSPPTNANKKTRSLLNLNQNRGGTGVGVGNALRAPESPGGGGATEGDVVAAHQRPHKSMEFLLDKENLHFVAPPENELQKVGERVPSEHELRVQRSLQRLNVPDWYKNSPAARDGFRLKRHSDASQHGGGWRALGSKTTSLSSLSSPNKPATGPLLLSPSPTPPVFSRWSTSLLNSAGSSPASSARSSFNHRQPYLGWRSQERLSNPRTPAERLAQGILPNVPPTSKQTTCFGPAQQLEVRNSIKEVTSAIVHYVQSGQEVNHGGRLSPRPDDWDDGGSARSTSPRGSVKLCWMESSFVGTRPVDSPETPMSLTTDADCCVVCNSTATESCTCVDSAASGLFLDLTPENDHRMSRSLSSQCQRCHRRGSGSVHSETEEAMAAAALLRNKPSPGSTTLEDVLDSLLGLPPASRTPSPGPGPTRRSTAAGKSCSTLRQDLQESANAPPDANHVGGEGSFYAGGLTRRKSEGSDTIPQRHGAKPSSSSRNRRVSFDNAQDSSPGVNLLQQEKTVRCRYGKCGASATAAEARRTFKSCHNCSYTYCSRECRRAHWERHRRTCLHSRAGTLCRQVLSSAKEDGATLRHISTLAQRGYASHGRGAVKCFFGSPEAAEKFINNGFIDLGEPTYARWSDLLPSEMGTELYSELMRLCKSYNPETRLVLYVAVCVVSEVPTTGAVRWERQLVSRCAKIRLANSCREAIPAPPPSSQLRSSTSPCNITREMDSPETLVLTSFPGNNGQNTPQRAREISFTNIQRQLRLRGVSLRRHFPQVYKKLCSYVDGSVDKFAPVTIYPRDHASGKSFMCIIMLDAEPERLQLLPTDSSRVRTVDISIEQE